MYNLSFWFGGMDYALLSACPWDFFSFVSILLRHKSRSDEPWYCHIINRDNILKLEWETKLVKASVVRWLGSQLKKLGRVRVILDMSRLFSHPSQSRNKKIIKILYEILKWFFTKSWRCLVIYSLHDATLEFVEVICYVDPGTKNDDWSYYEYFGYLGSIEFLRVYSPRLLTCQPLLYDYQQAYYKVTRSKVCWALMRN